jgi:hypothetical protein
MFDSDFETQFEKRRFKVIVPHIPYLPSDQDVQVSYQRVKDDGELYKYIKLKAFPLDDATYSYSESVDVLEIFTSRWQHGRCDPWTAPYSKAVGEPAVSFTLSEFKANKDASKLLEKFCRKRKRKDGLGGKLFAEQEEPDDNEELLD